jgi:hypothetical protein
MTTSGKMNLSALKKATKRNPIIEATQNKKSEATVTTLNTSNASTSSAGRPPLPKAERRSEKIQIAVTPEELAKIEKLSGYEPNANFIRRALEEKGVL